jgi:dTDP-4-amino-4,6-dideoxy-D-galactose acyltransferase
MKMTFQRLDWDSDFFHFNVCRIYGQIRNPGDIKEVHSLMEKNKFRLAYYSSVEELETREFYDPALGIKPVDKKTTYLKKTDRTLKSHPSVFSYEDLMPCPKLLDLALQCGACSRFNVDEKIGTDKFEELYKLWITKSTKRELANEVLVYKQEEDIAGFISIGEKNGRADLILAAVDSDYRGKGIGRILFQDAEKWSYDRGYEYIQIVTQGDNIPACKLYESLGYKVEIMEYFYHIWNSNLTE